MLQQGRHEIDKDIYLNIISTLSFQTEVVEVTSLLKNRGVLHPWFSMVSGS